MKPPRPTGATRKSKATAKRAIPAPAAAAAPTAAATKTPGHERIAVMDIARGCAVMGIVLMNIIAFSMPEAAYLNPDAWGGESLADRIAWLAGFVLIDGKMRGLFSMLFGASMLLLMDRVEMAGGDGRTRHIVRCFWLLMIGLAHYLLLWWGDIVSLYAIIGLVALPLVGRKPIDLVKYAFLAFLAQFALLTLKVIDIHHALAAAGANPPDAARAARLLDQIGQPGSAAIAREVALHQGGWSGLVAHRAADFWQWVAGGLSYTSLDTLGFMLLGMAMLKGGFLTGRWPRENYLATARHCFLIGVPPMLALGLWCWASGFDVTTTFGAAFAWSFPFRIPLTVGWAALIMALALGRAPAALLSRIEAAGRVSLSNYLGTSLVMAAIFQGWGLGLFGKVSRAEVYLFVPPAWALMLLWSRPWLARFAQGPAEWVWRSLTLGRPQPLRNLEKGRSR